MYKKLIVSFLFFGLLVGCSEQASLEPVSIDKNVDSCAECNMGILEVNHAAQIILEDGTPKLYDDIGCMLIDYDEQQDKLGVAYVPDYNSDEWIDMKEATFLQHSNIPTPMSYGIIAFKSPEEAETFRAANRGGGDLFDGDEILQLDVQSLKQEMEHDHLDDEMSDSDE